MQAMGNKLIDVLSPASRKEILAISLAQPLPVGTPLYRPEEKINYVYFMTSGLASVVIPLAEGTSAELMLIGSEGMTGSIQLLGPACIPATCFVQLAATGLRVRFTDLRRLFHESVEIRSRILEFVQHGALTVSQIAGCNRLHPADQRLARWLLMAQDRTESDVLKFTHEFLADMLALQRTTVAGALHDAGLIRYSRGQITIQDRQGLEARACSCFPTVNRLLQGLYRQPVEAPNKILHPL